MFSKIAFLLVISLPSFASYEAADRVFGNGTISLAGYRRVIPHLVDGKMAFAAIPWMKDYLIKNGSSLDSEMEETFDKMLTYTGIKPFEGLPEDVLKRSRSGNIKYILAKRLLKRGFLNEAFAEINQVSAGHSISPFAANMKGVISANLGRHADAVLFFKDCIRFSERMIGAADSKIQENQFQMNRDYCIAGLARSQFATKDFKGAESTYLDISKDSFVWPQILFEEAWTSYYLGNYNRTLGKLVSYKAPVFNFIFNPEIEVLKSLSFMKMCLYDDAKKSVDSFYATYLNPSKDLKRFIDSRGKDYRYYYNLLADFEMKRSSPLPILDTILASIRKDAALIELKGALNESIEEYNQLRKKPASSLRSGLTKNVKTLLDEYRTVIGAYVRAGVVSQYLNLSEAFDGMSYIKLEVLAQRKEKLYRSDEVIDGKRGDVKYIDRNDKQYFWTFNGEFWADELGDYVFALGSEC